jgi:hypothetical protein
MNGRATDQIQERTIALTLHFSRREDDTTSLLAQALEKWRLCTDDLAGAKEIAARRVKTRMVTGER